MGKFDDLTGRKFNRLLVLERADDKIEFDGRRRVAWLCLCDCGNKHITTTFLLKSGKVKSCGCLKVEKIQERCVKHGGCSDRLYKVWTDMKKRCYNPHYKQYNDYGGRGIRICNEWLNDYSAFREFAMKNGYDETAKFGDCTIDRIDVDGDYCPGNCRFVDMKTQNANKRRTKYEQIQ